MRSFSLLADLTTSSTPADLLTVQSIIALRSMFPKINQNNHFSLYFHFSTTLCCPSPLLSPRSASSRCRSGDALRPGRGRRCPPPSSRCASARGARQRGSPRAVGTANTDAETGFWVIHPGSFGSDMSSRETGLTFFCAPVDKEGFET